MFSSIHTRHDPASPKLRGVLHHWGALFFSGAGLVLVASAPGSARVAAAAYAGSLVLMLTISALYHRVSWSPPWEERMRRLDHSMIFFLILGSYTPPCLLALPQPRGQTILALLFAAVLLGVLRAQLWRSAPRAFIVGPYLLVGWFAVFYLGDFWRAFTPAQFGLFLAGGVAYSTGALAYALQRPEPIPGIFGHHEVFHALTLVASLCHFSANFLVVLAA